MLAGKHSVIVIEHDMVFVRQIARTVTVLHRCKVLMGKPGIAAGTTDVFTKEDDEFLVHHNALDASRIRAVETGGWPHAAIRADISANLLALEELHREFHPAILLNRIRRRQSGRPLQPGAGQLHHPGHRRLRRCPFVVAQVKHGVGVAAIIDQILHSWQHALEIFHQHG